MSFRCSRIVGGVHGITNSKVESKTAEWLLEKSQKRPSRRSSAFIQHAQQQIENLRMALSQPHRIGPRSKETGGLARRIHFIRSLQVQAASPMSPATDDMSCTRPINGELKRIVIKQRFGQGFRLTPVFPTSCWTNKPKTNGLASPVANQQPHAPGRLGPLPCTASSCPNTRSLIRSFIFSSGPARFPAWRVVGTRMFGNNSANMLGQNRPAPSRFVKACELLFQVRALLFPDISGCHSGSRLLFGICLLLQRSGA